MATIIDGKALRNKILTELKNEIEVKKLKPKLVIILVGDNEASLRYISQKQKAAQEIGAVVQLVQLPSLTNQENVIQKIESLNNDTGVTGIIVQLPLPSHLDKERIISAINTAKDVDGLTENSPFQPATPLGIMEILSEYKVELKGKIAVVLGRSKLVGEPIKKLLEKADAKVIQIHSQTPKPIDLLVQQGDIVISAVGRGPKLVTVEMLKEGAVVIDVGTNSVPRSEIRIQKSEADSGSRIPDYQIVGDVDFEKVKEKASLITPVPGGVGPMTVAMLMKNLIQATKNQTSVRH